MRIASIVILLCAAGCPQHGFIDDGSSVSWGKASGGVLLNPARLPNTGTGFYTPKRWANRGLRYGTDEMITTLKYVGKELQKEHPGRAVGVADLSLKRGGRSAWHRSHQTGRDVDLVFLAKKNGKVFKPTFMSKYDASGKSGQLEFDTAANWSVIKAFITNPHADIQYAFVSDPLRQRLLDYAMAKEERWDIVEAASYLLRQPSDSAPHDDHFHIRILCAGNDVSMGCREYGTLRWYKSDLKYRQRHH